MIYFPESKNKKIQNSKLKKLLVEYLDITKLGANLEITNPSPITSSGYTMGFWMFSTTGAFAANLLKIVYEDNFMFTISTQTNLFGYCFTGLEYQDIDSYLASATSLANFEAGTDKNDINWLKSSQLEVQKWQYIRCGYSYDNLKMYVDVNKAGFGASNLKTATLKYAAYFKGGLVFPPPRKIMATNPKLRITKLNALSTESVFIRNFVLFADYIHPDIFFHYM